MLYTEQSVINMKKTIKVLLVTIGIILFLMFTVTIIGNIFNIGNVVGIMFALAFLVLGIFYDKIASTIKHLRKSKVARVFLYTAGTAVSCVLLSFFIALGSVIASSGTNADNQKTVIILGCAVYDETPSIMLRARTMAALDYLEQNDDAVAILSGGQGKDESISEAECMYRLLSENGIDASRLYFEDKSTNTYENITNSLEIIRENGLSESIAIASSDFHLKRATMIAEKQGVKAKRISSKSGVFDVPIFYVRDTLGVIKEFIFR